MSGSAQWKSPSGKRTRERWRPTPWTTTTTTTPMMSPGSSKMVSWTPQGHTETRPTGDMKSYYSVRKQMTRSPEKPVHHYSPAAEPMPVNKYPWKLIRHLKQKLGIDPSARAYTYIFKVFQGWEVLYDDEHVTDCLCGKKKITYVFKLVRETNQHIEIDVGNKCVGLFEAGLAESAERALEYLKENPLQVSYEGPTKSNRHKFQVYPRCWPKKHPLFEDEKVLEFLKNVFQYVFVEIKGKKCFIEAKLDSEEMLEEPLKTGYHHYVRITPNVWCADFGSGVNLTVEIPPKYRAL